MGEENICAQNFSIRNVLKIVKTFKYNLISTIHLEVR